MADQYKLRLGDGTVLAVDEQGLRTWLLDAKAMVQRPGSGQWRALKEVLAEIARAAPVAPKPAVVAPPPTPSPVAPPARVKPAPLAESVSIRPGAKVDDGIPIIPFKRLDDDEAPRPGAVPAGDLREVAAAALEGEAPASFPWAGAKPRPNAPAATTATVAAHAADMSARVVPTAGPVIVTSVKPATLVREGPIDPASIVYPPVPGEKTVRAALEWGREVVTRGREELAKLPTPPLAPVEETLAAPETRRRLRRGAVLAVSGAAVIVLAVSLAVWWPRIQRARTSAPTLSAGLVLPSAPPVAPVPELPKEVQVAMAQLPHLTPDTIELVMASGDTRSTDPPEVFRRASIATTQGLSALSDDEARELRGLMNGVLGALRRVDRDRVRAYGRLSTQRDLLVEEDRKVLALFARGVRALPATRRERLQELSGKAVAAGLPSRTAAGGAATAAP